ncbi:MAG: hypothetical protein KF691_01460 [Phycisphaeraceae bacterium]|nr:hypothetical protein [Phycisphaeraceae bacterium]
MDPQGGKSLSRSLGEFFGAIWKGVREPVGPSGTTPPTEKRVVRQETSEQVRETVTGNVVVRRTVIEELEIPAKPPKK